MTIVQQQAVSGPENIEQLWKIHRDALLRQVGSWLALTIKTNRLTPSQRERRGEIAEPDFWPAQIDEDPDCPVQISKVSTAFELLHLKEDLVYRKPRAASVK